MTATDTVDLHKFYDQIDRAVKMATTYTKKAADALHWQPRLTRYPTTYWDLIDAMLDGAVEVIERGLPDSYFELGEAGQVFGMDYDAYNLSDDLLERAEKVVAAIHDRRSNAKVLRRIAALENTAGRTPEEAKMYMAKAADLRRRSLG